MNIKIYKENRQIDLNNLFFKGRFEEDLKHYKNTFEKIEFQLPNLALLQGDKELIEKAFQDGKKLSYGI